MATIYSSLDQVNSSVAYDKAKKEVRPGFITAKHIIGGRYERTDPTKAVADCDTGDLHEDHVYAEEKNATVEAAAPAAPTTPATTAARAEPTNSWGWLKWVAAAALLLLFLSLLLFIGYYYLLPAVVAMTGSDKNKEAFEGLHSLLKDMRILDRLEGKERFRPATRPDEAFTLDAKELCLLDPGMNTQIEQIREGVQEGMQEKKGAKYRVGEVTEIRFMADKAEKRYSKVFVTFVGGYIGKDKKIDSKTVQPEKRSAELPDKGDNNKFVWNTENSVKWTKHLSKVCKTRISSDLHKEGGGMLDEDAFPSFPQFKIPVPTVDNSHPLPSKKTDSD